MEIAEKINNLKRDVKIRKLENSREIAIVTRGAALLFCASLLFSMGRFILGSIALFSGIIFGYPIRMGDSLGNSNLTKETLNDFKRHKFF